MKITFKVSVKLFLCKNRLKRKRGKFAGISLEISTRKKCKGNLTFYDFDKKFWTQGEASKEERLALQKFLSGDDGILAFSILDIWPTLFI